MTVCSDFNDILAATARSWNARKGDEGVLSLALPLKGVDPLKYLPVIAENHQFRFLWDGAPGLCLAASGHCQKLDLAGSRRFELAQRFSSLTLGRLTDVTPEAPLQASPRILLAFTFFEHTAERQHTLGVPPSVQVVLPRWQLTRQGHSGWLRLNGVATNEADARELVEQLWLMRMRLFQQLATDENDWSKSVSGIQLPTTWRECYSQVLKRGIELVNSHSLKKLVLAVRESIPLTVPLDPLPMLSRLRHNQAGSCRFLWQRNQVDACFGASPERLLSLKSGFLTSDALAGTAGVNDDGRCLLQSEKDRLEHELVVASITNELVGLGLEPRLPRRPRLARHGRLVHLHTPITASVKGQLPLHLADALHPTPAVAGLPRREAMSWLRTLEPFERGIYAAPIGWIDTQGNAEFRVAIRCGNIRGNQLELTAGAGLVRGSIAELELQEVGLKLAVLADQLEINSRFNSDSQVEV